MPLTEEPSQDFTFEVEFTVCVLYAAGNKPTMHQNGTLHFIGRIRCHGSLSLSAQWHVQRVSSYQCMRPETEA